MPINLYNMISRIERLRPFVTAVRQLPEHQPPEPVLLLRLMLAWGNFGYSAGFRYLQQVERLFYQTTGPVLECGCGATSVLLALLGERAGRQIVTFEHQSSWADYVSGILQSFQIDSINIYHTPLRFYDPYEWYTLPDTSIPSDFGLVICDGPPASIVGGRYGLMPVMSPHLSPACRILLDDTHRRKEQQLMKQWVKEQNLKPNRIGITGYCTELSFT